MTFLLLHVCLARYMYLFSVASGNRYLPRGGKENVLSTTITRNVTMSRYIVLVVSILFLDLSWFTEFTVQYLLNEFTAQGMINGYFWTNLFNIGHVWMKQTQMYMCTLFSIYWYDVESVVHCGTCCTSGITSWNGDELYFTMEDVLVFIQVQQRMRKSLEV